MISAAEIKSHLYSLETIQRWRINISHRINHYISIDTRQCSEDEIVELVALTPMAVALAGSIRIEVSKLTSKEAAKIYYKYCEWAESTREKDISLFKRMLNRFK